MAGFARMDLIELGRGLQLLRALDFDRRALLEVVGAMGESQTRRRLSKEKTSPDGVPWSQWSEAYAETRAGGQSLLQDSRALTDSIRWFVDGDAAVWGSDLLYAGRHNDGGTDKRGRTMPQRQFVGLSAGNIDDIEAEAAQFLDDLLQF